MGISDKYVNIVSNFLRKRQIRVKIGDVLSEPKEVLSGVPHGSVIGPLLFLIYVNDIPSMLRSVSKMFADDIKIIVNPNQYSLLILSTICIQLNIGKKHGCCDSIRQNVRRAFQ